MAFIIKDRIKEATTTEGLVDLALGGAAATFDPFGSFMVDGDTTYYAVVHTSSGVDEWEVGLGTYDQTANAIVRTTVISGSNGASAVNFSAGVKDIFMTYPAEIAVYTDGSGDLSSNIGLGNHSTTELVEGSNLYYTDARVDAHLSGGTGVTYSAGTISIGQDVSTTADVTFNSIETTDGFTVGGTATIQGDLIVNGTTTTVNAENLAIADNLIYLNEGSAITNPDLGWSGNYNDGTYAHAGVFRDATDGMFKFFDGYVPEPDEVGIDPTHATYNDADIKFGTGYGDVTGNLTGNVTGNLTGDTAGTHTGAVVGSVTGDLTGNADTATALETARTIQLTGDVTGSVSFNGTADAVITATVVDDSHAHVISNVDGLQAALDAKVDDTTTITSGTGLTGGGDLSVNRTLSLDTTYTDGRYANITGDTFTGDVTVPNLITAGTVDGRDVSADGSKLDGIEAGATGDQTAAEILTAIKTVDGSGSGLDADLLDGFNSGDFIYSSGGYTYGPITQAMGNETTIVTSTSGVANQTLWRADGLNQGSIRLIHNYSDDSFSVNMYNGGAFTDALKVNQNGSINITGDINVGSQTGTWVTSNAMSDSIGWNTTYGTYIGSNISGNNDYIYGSGVIRKNNTFYSLYHSGNDGSGSGLDADLLDGVHGSSYLRSDASGTITGDNRSLSFGVPGGGSTTGARFLSIEGNSDTSGEASGRIFFTEHNSTTASMDNYGFSIGYRGGDTSVVGASGNTWTGLSQIGNGEWGMWGHDNNATGSLIAHGPRSGAYADFTGLKVGGSDVWHAGNDGSGSGLDADLLDGVQGSSYLRSDTSDTFTSLSGTSLTIGSGVTLQESTDRADLLQITSSTSSWAGLQIRNSSNEGRWSLMMDGGTFGLYDDENNKWHIQALENSETRLYYNASEKLNTNNTGVNVNGKLYVYDKESIVGTPVIGYTNATGVSSITFYTGSNLSLNTKRVFRVQFSGATTTATSPLNWAPRDGNYWWGNGGFNSKSLDNSTDTSWAYANFNAGNPPYGTYVTTSSFGISTPLSYYNAQTPSSWEAIFTIYKNNNSYNDVTVTFYSKGSGNGVVQSTSSYVYTSSAVNSSNYHVDQITIWPASGTFGIGVYRVDQIYDGAV